MANPEIVREFVNGEWVTTLGSSGGGGGGLPTGWTQDGANPSNLDSNGGNLTLDNGSISAENASIDGGVSIGSFMSPPGVFSGTVDPSAGGGVSHTIGSLYMRSNGELWIKTGAGNTDWTQAGGVPSAAIHIVRVPLLFNTPNLAATDGTSTGVIAYTPSAGEAIFWPQSYFSVPTTAFDHTDGDTNFHLTFSDLDGAFFGASVDGATDQDDSGTKQPVLESSGNWVYTASPRIFPDATPLRVVFDDGAGGDPGMTQGEGVLVLTIMGA